MATQKNSKDYIVVIDQDKIEPDLARETVVNFDPLNRAGKDGGFHITEEEELHIDEEKVMEAHKMAINKYPYDDAIKLVKLDWEEGDIVHQYGDNSFRLYGIPAPEEGRVVGILGRNGIGKTTALEIVSGDLKPNLGDYENPADWEDIHEKFRGTALQTHFEALKQGEIDAAFKPQQVDLIPEVHDGNVRELLEENDERDALEEVAEKLGIDNLLDRELEELSGGELQRVAIAATAVKDADLYIIDEPSSFLDVKHRLQTGELLRSLGEDNAVMIVEHDLATLDLVSSGIHILHGDPGSYGRVSDAMSTRDGINQYLDGYLRNENIRIRSDEINFDRSKRSQVENKPVVFSFPELEQQYGEGFSLEVKEGALHEEEVLGIFGGNGLGKTTFAKMLAGIEEPEEGESPDVEISYKPQYLEVEDETVEAAISKHINPQSKKFETRIAEPLGITELYEQDLKELSGGELQKVATAICLAKDADVYLLDEPSAFLDVESRVELGKTLKRFARKTEKPLMVIDHDLLLLDYVSDRGMIFTGEPGEHGTSTEPMRITDAMNEFLKEVDLTFRKDPETGRPRANKPDSQKDQQQRESGDYYEQ